MFRVQKVLLAEYEEIYEPVLVENPFTLVDIRGMGLRQYQIGLTCNRLLFGCDNFSKYGDVPSFLARGLDPEIESFELVSMLPLQLIRFHFFRKATRCLMMLNIVQPLGRPLAILEHPMIFEFGGHIFKQHFWHTWRERVASIRVMQPIYGQITGASPFSSTDVQLDEELTVAQVHPVPRTPSLYSACHAGTGDFG
ncbi:uncharacterized protein LOC119558708 [Drosophila subpulchrella]|uniref:uncharacterized protein LOC119550322 n=1 Tax=Drosophila subpulchrella TaxID=1486046 RepID=UPI0018A14618|nr:uncharacterized protein LOC119550322 [Drosophila subpulchrella]XP_037727980.1 uncharacterized protein LOC119558708 [Drosophila subpulchrella]